MHTIKRNEPAYRFKQEAIIAVYGVTPISYIIISLLVKTLFPGNLIIFLASLFVLTATSLALFFILRRNLSPLIINGHISGGRYPLYLKMSDEGIVLYYIEGKSYFIDLKDMMRIEVEPIGDNQRQRLKIYRKRNRSVEIIVDGKIASDICHSYRDGIQIDVFEGGG